MRQILSGQGLTRASAHLLIGGMRRDRGPAPAVVVPRRHDEQRDDGWQRIEDEKGQPEQADRSADGERSESHSRNYGAASGEGLSCDGGIAAPSRGESSVVAAKDGPPRRR